MLITDPSPGLACRPDAVLRPAAAFYVLVFGLLAHGSFARIRLLAILLGCASSAFWLARMARGLDLDTPLFGLPWLDDDRVSGLLLVQHGMFFAIGILPWSVLVDRHPARKGSAAWLALLILAGCVQIAAQCGQYNAILSAQHAWTVACAWWLASLAAIVLSVRCNARLATAHPAIGRLGATLARRVYPLYLINFSISSLVFAACAFYRLPPAAAAVAALAVAGGLSLPIAPYLEHPLQARMKPVLRHWLAAPAR